MTAVYVPEGNPDSGAVWHYGDPLGEQRAALTGAALIDRSTRPVITLSGPERLSWLHTISSQHVADLQDGQTRENLNLDGQGRVEDHWIQTDLDGVTYLDTEPWRGQALKDFLAKMVFWAKVEVASSDLKVFTLLGPDTDGLADKLGIAALPDFDRAVALPGGGLIRRVPWPLPDATFDLLVPSGQGLAERLGVRPAGLWAFEALRVAAARPRLGVDTDERTIPHEVAWIAVDDDPRAVHLTKGCYRGQETVARVHNLGKSPRVLVLLHLDGSADRPSTGDEVAAGGRAVGRVGSVTDHVDLGPIALALVKRSVVEALADGNPAPLSAGPSPAAIDLDLLPDLHGEQRGRDAVNRLRQGSGQLGS
ncbi:glycine cleavage system protein T [Mycobacteroides saopaulense]|uniref:CAF17-like 4Fe-4S cluster assembly/insertion protein YgfZ n=1 Tax=Mycobacteroides saopaulense TaxID=1578165 RepID=UPI000720B756|nr:folate-binding protein YgfZ [Mycobacteroides saopaulense]ALR10636.1 glycine cleavage system protein T [Mycobacteroides saopaulense]